MNTTRLALLVLLALHVAPSMGDELAQILDSGSHNTGVMSVNQAAGEQNQQANLRAISTSSGLGQSNTPLQQHIHSPALAGNHSRAVIGDQAFSQSMGLLGINQSAGQQNQSVNSVAISMAGKAIGTPMVIQDQLLAASTASAKSLPDAPASAQATISQSAFQGSRGVIQINQIAGSQNQAANLLTVQWVSP